MIAKFHRTDLVICSHSREKKTLFYSLINTVFTYKDLSGAFQRALSVKISLQC